MADPTTPAPAASPAPAAPDPTKWVPYDRFQQLVAQKNELQTALDAQATETNTWREKAATADTIAKQFEEARSGWETERGQWQTKSAAYQHGVTDNDLVDLALWQYDRVQPAEGESKPPFGEWLAGLKATPDALPPALAGLKTAWAPAAAPAAAAPGAPAPAAAPPAAPAPQGVALDPRTGAPVTRAQPSPNAGAVGTATVPQSFTRGSIANMTDAQYRAYRKTIAPG